MIIVIFAILLFFLLNGFRWNIQVLGGFFHHGLMYQLTGFLRCHQNSSISGSSSTKTLRPCDTPPNSLKDSNVNLKMKTMKKGATICSFVRSTSRVRRVCWSFEMGNKTSGKWVNYSYGYAQTKQQVGQCIVGTFLVHGQTMGIHEFTRLTRPEFGGSHHLPPYSILYDQPWGLQPNVIFFKTSKSGILKFRKLGFLPLWKPITSCVNLQLK